MTSPATRPRFVVQRHDATSLHFDLRLEIGGTLASWAVPKGPSLDPAVKRLAVRVGDHDLAHLDVEGQVGTGTTIVWDTGALVHTTQRDGVRLEAGDALDRGHLTVELHGRRLTGGFALTRTRMDGNDATWLLVKVNDAAADRQRDVTAETTSVLTGRTNADYAAL